MSIGSPSFWLEEVALPLGAVGMEAVPIGALLILGAAWQANDPTQALLPVWALLVIELGVFWLERWLLTLSWSRLRLNSLLAVLWLLLLSLVWYVRFYQASGPLWSFRWLSASVDGLTQDDTQAVTLVALAVLLTVLWLRGMTLAREPKDYYLISRNFKIGFALLILPFVFSGAFPPQIRDVLALQLGLLLPLFLFLGLSALSLARLAEIRRERRGAGSPPPKLLRRWLLAMLSVSGALALLLLALELIFSYQTLQVLIAALQPLVDAVGTVLGWLVIAVAYIFYGIYLLIYLGVKALYSLFASGKQPVQPPQPPPGKPLPQNTHPPGVPADWLAIGRWALIVVAVVVLLAFLLRALLAVRPQDTVNAEEERENLDAMGLLGAQLRGLFAGLAARFRRQGAQGVGSGDGLSAASVRALYRRMLAQVAALGLGRRAQETPQELAERLVVALPSSEAIVLTDLAALTTAYEQARYGEQEPPPERLTTLQESTDRLLSHLSEQNQQMQPSSS